MYLTEKNFELVEITNVDLALLNEEEVNTEKQRQNSIGVSVKKFEY